MQEEQENREEKCVCVCVHFSTGDGRNEMNGLELCSMPACIPVRKL